MPRSGRVLQQMTEHVAYEIEMLQHTTEALMSTEFDIRIEAQRITKNALLESNLVHLRALDDFLRLEDSDNDDVLAVHYTDQWKVAPILTKKERAHINKRTQHISSERIKGPLPWQLKRSMEGVEACTRFLRQLEIDQPLRAGEFRKHLSW